MKQAQPINEFTGRHMLFAMVAFFGVVIAVNVAMAIFAQSSWTGLVVANSYVASQEFNAKMAETRAQASLQWTSALSIRPNHVSYGLKDRSGMPVALAGATMTFRRPVDDREDRSITLAPDNGVASYKDYSAGDGVWLVDVSADAGLEHPYRETFRVHVRGGSMQ